MNCDLTLNFIKENWCAATHSMDRWSFCRAILPDAYSTELCQGQGEHFLNKNAPNCLADQTLMGLMRGNRKSAQNLDFASVAFTKDFQQKLAHNSPIRYRDRNRAEEQTVENMLGKLRMMIRRYCEPINRSHILFTHMDFTLRGTGSEEKEFEKVQLAIQMLLDRETETSLTYALFLMIITAILQSRIGTVQHLYSIETIEQVLRSDEEAPVMEVEGRTQVPFTDPNYMHTYNIYFFRDTPDRELWSGKLTMKMAQNRAVASMTLNSQAQSPFTGEKKIQRVFNGIPMLSKQDHMVYIAMTDQTDTFAYLTFAHTKFSFMPMYYRSGLLISSAPETKYPIVQRVAIVARDLTEEELPYVWGLLKTDGKQVLLSEKQYGLFLEKFRDYPWMKDFEAYYKPMFEAHKKELYCFNEDELLAWSIGELTHEDRLRILLALRSVDSPNNIMLGKFMESIPPSRTHAILK